MLCASRVPSEALLPMAAMHRPALTAAAVAVELTRYVVFAVVMTVRDVAALLPNASVFSTIREPETLVTVPVAPPKPPNPPVPRWSPPPPEPGVRPGAGVGAPEGRTPPGPRPPNPDRAAQADVEVTVTLVAVRGAVGDGAGNVPDLGDPELAVMQSPTAIDELLPMVTRVNRVDVAQATTVVPEEVATLTPELETAVALPVAAVNPPKPPLVDVGPCSDPDPGDPAPDVPVAPFAELHAARASADIARPATGRRRVRVSGEGLT